jgi:hypothetical protein
MIKNRVWRQYVEDMKAKCPPRHTFELHPYQVPIAYTTSPLEDADYVHFYEEDDEMIFSHENFRMTPAQATKQYGIKMEDDANYGFRRISPNLYLEFDDDRLSIVCSFSMYDVKP